MRSIIIFLTFFVSMSASAQNIEHVLQSIEHNNADYKARQCLSKAQRIEARTGNVPENPEVDMMRGWSRDGSHKALEFDVSQSFDFPSAYAARRKAANAKIEQIGYEQNAYRQSLLLEAKTLCIDIVALRQEYALLSKRVANTQRMADAQVVALQNGEITVLEKNLTDIELIDLQSRLSMKTIELNTALEQLQNMNGGIEIVFPDSLFAMPEEVLPYDVMVQEYKSRAPQLLMLVSEQKHAEMELKAGRSEALPSFSVGYHFEKEGNETLNGLVVGMSLPLWGSRRRIQQNKAQVEYAKSQYVTTETDMLSTLRELYARYNVLKEALAQLRAIDLRQVDIEKYLHKAFEAGEISEIDYLSELNMLYNVEEQCIATERDLHKVIAEINALNL